MTIFVKPRTSCKGHANIRRGSFFLSATFFFLPYLPKGEASKKENSLSRVCVRARFVENKNSLELYILFLEIR